MSLISRLAPLTMLAILLNGHTARADIKSETVKYEVSVASRLKAP